MTEKELIDAFYTALFAFRNTNFTTQNAAAKALGISPARFVVAGNWERFGRNPPRPRRALLEKCRLNGDDRLKEAATAVLASYGSGEDETEFDFVTPGVFLSLAADDGLLRTLAGNNSTTDLEARAVAGLFYVLGVARNQSRVAREIHSGQVPAARGWLLNESRRLEAATNALKFIGEGAEAYELILQCWEFDMVQHSTDTPERIEVDGAVAAYILESIGWAIGHAFRAEARTKPILRNRAVYALANKAFELCEQNLPYTEADARSGLAWLEENDPEEYLAKAAHINAVLNVLRLERAAATIVDGQVFQTRGKSADGSILVAVDSSKYTVTPGPGATLLTEMSLGRIDPNSL